ncbi:hypothetical protein ACSVDM_30125 [Nocardia sp. JW2]|uniref:hypothetical protein n=1 Tax=Nocardia sp. JW2 TaxID=3450738 RepID=UPI003F442393
MLSGRETSKPYAVRVALVAAAVTIGVLGSAGQAAALPGSGSASGSADLAIGSATGSANLATGSAAGSSDTGAAGGYFAWQSSQFLNNTLRFLLSLPQGNLR